MAHDLRFLPALEALDAEMRLAQQQLAELQAKQPRVYASTLQWGPFSAPVYQTGASMLGGVIAGHMGPPVAKRAYGQGMTRPQGWYPVLKFPGYSRRSLIGERLVCR